MIRIELPADPAEHVTFSCSPLLECVLSLHVLVGPKHHALQHGWVRAMRALSPSLRRDIAAFAFVYRWHLPDMLVPFPHDSHDSFEEELERVCSYSSELLLEEFGRPLFDHGGRHGERLFEQTEVRKTMLARAATDGPVSLQLAQLLLDDPATFARRFAQMLTDYWQAAFAAEWERIEPLFAKSVAEATRLLATAGVWPVLGRLPAHCRADTRTRELLIDLPHGHSVAISAENPLVLSPSVFVWPHIRVNCDPPWPTALVYVAPEIARQAAPRLPPSELLEMLRALGDDTRLRVLKLIAERPRTTQELAPLVGLSVAGLSKSLRRLAEAPHHSSTRRLLRRLQPRPRATHRAERCDRRLPQRKRRRLNTIVATANQVSDSFVNRSIAWAAASGPGSAASANCAVCEVTWQGASCFQATWSRV